MHSARVLRVSFGFCTFCDELLREVSRLPLLATSYYEEGVSSGWQLESLANHKIYRSNLQEDSEWRAPFTFPHSHSEEPKPGGNTFPQGPVQIMRTHFNDYLCTHCSLNQNIGFEIYASHMYSNESVQVSVIAHLWDKLHDPKFRKWNPKSNSYQMVLQGTFQLKMFKPAELHVSLTLSNKQKTTWQYTQFEHMPETTQEFVLNWSKMKCRNCQDVEAMKYTELGPFSACWMLKSQKGVIPSRVEACVTLTHLQIQGSLKLCLSRKPFPIHISLQPHKNDGRVTINIKRVGTMHIAQQHNAQENGMHTASSKKQGEVQ